MREKNRPNEKNLKPVKKRGQKQEKKIHKKPEEKKDRRPFFLQMNVTPAYWFQFSIYLFFHNSSDCCLVV